MARETHILKIVVQGDDQGATSVLKNVGGALGGVATVAGGILSANLITGVGRSLAGLGRDLVNVTGQAFDASAAYETLGKSLELLVAREIQRSSVQTDFVAVGQRTVELTDAQRARQAELNDELTLARVRVQRYQQALSEANAEGDQLGASEAQARMNQWARKVAELEGQMNNLTAAEGQVVTMFEKVTSGGMSMSEALQHAAPRAQELLKWIQELAIKSPFDQEGVAIAFRTAMAYGFTTEEAQRLTRATIDFATATGASTDAMNSINLALGQMAARGKVSMQEILQLTNAGVPAMQILQDAFSMTGNELERAFRSGQITAEEAIEVIVASLEKDFAGAAERSSETLAGLRNTFGDLNEMGLREFFGGVFSEVKPIAAAFADWMQDEGLQKAHELGQTLGVIAGNLVDIGEFAFTGELPTDGIFWLTEDHPAIRALGKMQEIFRTLFPKQEQPDMQMRAQIEAGVDPSSAAGFQAAFPTPPEGFGERLMGLFPPELQDNILGLSGAVGNLRDAFVQKLPEIEEEARLWKQNMATLFAETNFLDTLTGNTESTLNNISALWTEHGDGLVANTFNVFGQIVGLVGAQLVLVSGVIGAGTSALAGDWEGAWQGLRMTADTYMGLIASVIGQDWESIKTQWATNTDLLRIIWNTKFPQIRDAWSNNWTNLETIASTIWGNVTEGISTAVQDIKADIAETLGGAINSFKINVLGPFERAWGGIVRALDAVKGAWLDLKLALEGGLDVPGWLLPGSPTPFEIGLRGVHDAMAAVARTSHSFGEAFAVPDTAQQAVGNVIDMAQRNGGVLTPAAAGAGAGGRSLTINFSPTFEGTLGERQAREALDMLEREANRRGFSLRGD